MKMNSFKILSLILFVAFGLGACENFLTPNPDNLFDKDRFISDAPWARGLLINAYTSSAYPRDYPFDEVATDDAVSNDLANNYMRMATGEWSSLFYPNNVWSASYTAIMYMNYFLDIADEVKWSTDTIRHRLSLNRYKSEALGFRGFYYHRLLQQFGGIAENDQLMGVPVINEVITSSDEWKVQRSTYQETLAQINADYTAAIKGLPYVYFDISPAVTPADLEWNRVNGGSTNANLLNGRSVTALKARLALMAASPAYNGGTNYNLVQADSAARIAARLIQRNGGLTACLAADAIWWNEDTDISNPDILWRNDWANSNGLEATNYPPSLSGSGRINPTQNLVDAYPMKNGYPITHPLSGYDAANPYNNRDPRLNVHILYNGGRERSVGTIGNNNVINTQFDNAVNNDGLQKLTGFSTRTGYYLKKLLRTDVNMTSGSVTSQRHFYPIIRWTEILLIYAEALNEVSGPDADLGIGKVRDVIGAIRKRGGGNARPANASSGTIGGIDAADPYLASITTPAAMRALIRNERRIELSFEGFRFWDLRRWNVPLAELNANAQGVKITGVSPALTYNLTDAEVNPVEERKYQSNSYYGPIPYLETKKYPGFLQNKGW